eukprot:gene6103-biopygen13505
MVEQSTNKDEQSICPPSLGCCLFPGTRYVVGNEEKTGYLAQLGGSGSARGLDTALIHSPEDQEESLNSPVLVPRIGDLPVGGSVELTPANNLDGVSSEGAAGGVLVDATLRNPAQLGAQLGY